MKRTEGKKPLYPSKIEDYLDKIDLLTQIARMYYLGKMTHEAIGHALGISPRAKVAAMCEAARALVHTAIVPPYKEDDHYLDTLAKRVIERLGLLDCKLVHGRKDILYTTPGGTEEGPDPDRPAGASTDSTESPVSVREVIVDSIARGASSVILKYLRSMKEEPCVAFTYGVVTRRIADHLDKDVHLSRRGLAVAATGARSPYKEDRFDANIIVRDIARRLEFDYWTMPFPSVMKADTVKMIANDQEFDEIKNVFRRVNMVVGTLSSRHKKRDLGAFQSLLVKQYTGKELDQYSDEGAIGNFGGSFFGRYAQPIEIGKRVLGLSLDDLRGLTKREQPVIVACGADPLRLPALAVCLKYGLANVWVGDEYTARILLGESAPPLLEAFDKREELEILEELADNAGRDRS